MKTNNLPGFFKQAAEASQRSDHPTFKIGAALFIKSKFIVSGFNSLKTHPKIHRHKWLKTTHAELNAIIKAKAILNRNDLSDCKIVIYRVENKLKIPAISFPCDMCYAEIINAGIKEIIYTDGGSWKLTKVLKARKA